LQNAAKRLWILQQTLETNNKSKNSLCVIQVISEDERPATVARSCANHEVARGYQVGGDLDQAFIMIRLCRMDAMNEVLTPTTTEMEAKLIYNYSIASRCLAVSLKMLHCDQQKLEFQAFSPLKIAFANMLNDQDGMCSDFNKFNRALVLMLLMLHHLIDLLHKLGNDLHYQEYSTCLHKLQHWIDVLSCEMQSTTLSHASAA